MHTLSLTVPLASLRVLPTVNKGTIITEEMFFWVSLSLPEHILRICVHLYKVNYRGLPDYLQSLCLT